MVLAALALGGCDDGHGGSDPEHGRLEVLVDANVGDGRLAVEAPLGARQLAVARNGDLLLAGASSVRRVDARSGKITSVPGTTLETCADGGSLETPCGTNVVAVAVDRSQRVWFAVADGRIFSVGPGGSREHVLGQTRDGCPDGLPVAGAADEVCFAQISDLEFDRDGNLLVADRTGARVLRFDPASRTVTVVAGNGDGMSQDCADDVPADETCIGYATAIAADPAGGVVIAGDGLPIRRVDPATGMITRIAGRAERCFDGDRRDGGPARDACLWSVADVAVDEAGDLFVADVYDGTIRRVDAGTGIISTFAGPRHDRIDQALALDADDRLLALGFTAGYGGQVVWRFTRDGRAFDVVAGNGDFGFCGDGGPARDACLGQVQSVALGEHGAIYVSDLASRRVRRIANGTITTIAGNGVVPTSGEICADGEARTSCLDFPTDVVVDRAGDVYVRDGDRSGLDRIRRIDSAGRLTTIVGACRVEGDPTTVPAVDACLHVAAMASGVDGTLWVAENTRISRFDATTGRLVAVAAAPSECSTDVEDRRPQCFFVRALAVDASGTAYIADGKRVRRIATDGTIELLAGNGTEGDCGDGGPAADACLVALRVAIGAGGDVVVAGSGVVRRIAAATGVISHVAGRFDALCARGDDGRLVPPDSDCANVHAIDDEGRLLYPELSRFAIGRLVRLTP